MIKVVVAEDKPLILRSIKEKIRNWGPEIEIAGEATNGEAALALIRELKPDVVFTDIRMPLMDGLKLIAEARESGPELHFVIISGYDEFEYARQAMKLEVSEYLLKPVKQEEINAIMDKISSKINAARLEKQKKLLLNILNSNSTTTAAPVPEPGCDHYWTLLLNAGPYSNFVIDYANPFNGFWPSINLKDRLPDLLHKENSFWIFDGKSFNEVILVLGINGSQEFDIKEFTGRLKAGLEGHHTPVTIAVSQRLGTLSDLGIESQLLRALLKKNLLLGKSAVFFRGESHISSGSEQTIMESSLEKRLMTYIQTNQKGPFFREMEKLFKQWQEGSFSQSSIESLLKQIVRLCQKACLKSSAHDTDLELETDEIISSSRDFHGLLQGMRFIFEQFFASQDKNEVKSDVGRDIIKTVENYLNTCYSDPININDVARMVNLHPVYLSRLFKSFKGTSPMEYLTTLRIEKAKELLLSDSGLSLKEIAEIAGYSDQFYFSRIFKTITGRSPSEYKNANRA